MVESPGGKRRSSGAAGFTLLEALVVLVITSLVSAVVIQGFGMILSIRDSVASSVIGLESTVIERSIMSDAIKGVIPDYPENPNVFRGQRTVLSGLTVRSIRGPFGVPRPFRMEIAHDAARNQSSLQYTENAGPTITLAQWPGQAGSFAYRDITGDWKDVWPPQGDETAPQSPWLVRIQSGLAMNRDIVVYVASPHERRFRIEDAGLGASASGFGR
ncbi:MAG: prepilin-type N-terminal cleavage/methylation domain-containing protein [Rhodobacteraceae bacterium]|nr:prepilin-type N-terminal cleavage/methylation domain-containing protein [Paracoccaceae bacterium]